MAGANQNGSAITPGSPTDKAGLQENDIILEVDGQRIDKDHPLAAIAQSHNVGDIITLNVLSKGEEKIAKVVLGER